MCDRNSADDSSLILLNQCDRSVKILRCLVCDRNSADDSSLILLNQCDHSLKILHCLVCDRKSADDTNLILWNQCDRSCKILRCLVCDRNSSAYLVETRFIASPTVINYLLELVAHLHRNHLSGYSHPLEPSYPDLKPKIL